ncbi:protein ABCI12, chloroplastic-like [Euphorbia lathyris]|uniref:protein ABCI12, chloroplastic-like n=1 Tax=Euphorbia lathyris TaxID=212925 RepID=UPI0033131D1A
MSGLGSDGAPSLVQSRTPPPAMMVLPNLPVSLSGYSFLITKLGPLQFTRKVLSVASTASCLTFNAIIVRGFRGDIESDCRCYICGVWLVLWVALFYLIISFCESHFHCFTDDMPRFSSS